MTGAKRLGVQRRRTETQPFRCISPDATFRLETQNIFTGSWAWVAAGPVAHSTSDHVGTGRRFNDLGFELGGPAGRLSLIGHKPASFAPPAPALDLFLPRDHDVGDS
jgi:hypothetical protein